MSLRARLFACLVPLLSAACSKAVDEAALPGPVVEAEVEVVQAAELAGGPETDAARTAMDAAVAQALADAAAGAPPALVISNAPIPNPGEAAAPPVVRISMLPIPNPEEARRPPALLGAPEGQPAPPLEHAGAPEKPRRVGAMLQVAAAEPAAPAATPKPKARPAAASRAEPAAPARVVAAVAAAPAAVAEPVPPPLPATPMEAVIAAAHAAPPAPEDIELPRVAAGVTPVDGGLTLSPLMWLSGLALLAVAAVFAAVRLARREREPIRA